jgi:nucleoside-diphosphate-sugar epimerase
MGSERLPLQNKGIYKNLPSFDPNIKGLTAIVTGANGISGFHTMRVLLESPDRWKKVWAASRRPPPKDMMALLTDDQRSRVEHVACDFLSKPEDVAEQLKSKNVTADYVFFYSYAQPKPEPGKPAWSNAQELVDTNSALLRNFLEGLDKAGIAPKRFLLQTGAKNYGVHL